jgi:malic enzyme
VELADGSTRVPRNSHPVYIYPGLMYGLRLCAAQQLRDDMLLAAAESLASQVTDEDRAVGAVYPSMKNIRGISVSVHLSSPAVCVEAHRPSLNGWMLWTAGEGGGGGGVQGV